MPTDQDIKLTFIHQAVRQYAADVVRAMDSRVRKLKKIDTDALRASLDGKTEATNAGAIGKILFNEYGRYVDMGVGRGHKLGSGLQTLQANILASQGNTRSVARARKPAKFYSPVAYGKLNGLIEDIAYGLTEETKTAIKKQLESNV